MYITLAALVLSAGSIFAYANLSKTDTEKSCTEKCSTHCCNDDSGICAPKDCKK